MEANAAAWRQLRGQADLGIVEFAALIGVFPSTIVRIEQGHTTRPQAATVSAAAQLLAARLARPVEAVSVQLVGERVPEPV